MCHISLITLRWSIKFGQITLCGVLFLCCETWYDAQYSLSSGYSYHRFASFAYISWNYTHWICMCYAVSSQGYVIPISYVAMNLQLYHDNEVVESQITFHLILGIASVCCINVYTISQCDERYLCIHDLFNVLYAICFRNRRKRATSSRDRTTCDTQDSISGPIIGTAKAPGGHYYRGIQISDISYPQPISHAINCQSSIPVDDGNRLCDTSTFRPNIPKNCMKDA